MRKSSKSAVNVAGAGALALLLTASAFAEDRPHDRTWRDGDGGSARASAERVQRGEDRNRTEASAASREGSGRIERGEVRGRVEPQQGQARVEGRNDGRRDDSYRGGSAGAYGRGHDSYGRGTTESYGRNGSYRHYRENERVRAQGHISRYSHERGGYRVWLDNGYYSYWVPEHHWRNNWRVGVNIVLGGIFRGGMVYADVYDDPYYNDGYYGRGAEYVSGYVERVDYRTGTLWLREDRGGRVLTVDTRTIDRRYSRIDARDLQRGDRVSFTGTWLRGGLFAADRVDSIDTRY